MRLIVLAICITACAVRAQLMATKLHHAAQHADSSELAQLLEGNPNTNIGDALGRTPLMIAVENQREANVILLLKHDTNLSQVDNSGMTALDIANKRSDAGPIGVLLALAWRAPQLPEPRGDSAMSIAKHHGSREVRIAMGSWVLEATGTEPAGDALLSAAGVVPSAAL
ncbi:hypothetical protein FNF31_06853 [Cafeteria roenbergensis]|uniref:Uncharacterized protein n=1 Tax=Cafeteria roenbergensis TaxID=33653 RepID=A0A5A8CF94_CAFRO|nr:hypothetical protein FNF31_06853 [Cafeteria roenbergensis]